MTSPTSSTVSQATVMHSVSDTSTTTRSQIVTIGTVAGQAWNLQKADSDVLAAYDAELNEHMAAAETEAADVANRYYGAHYL